ncbi:MAG TPA: hypothetical protein VLD37_00850 [Candidatus Bilamarchaeum sp.]|nr:hypothetical protein [Candidatus Bilamarchaeum sp.]
MTRPFVIRTGSRALTQDQMRIREDVEAVRGQRIRAPPLVTCDPHSPDEEGRLETRLRHIGVDFIDLAVAQEVEGKSFGYVVGLTDKSQQNPINKIAGNAAEKDGVSGGDASMNAYFDTIGNSTWNIAAINGNQDRGNYRTRLGNRSDEGTIVIGGMTRGESVDDQFRMSWDVEKEHLDLSTYKYTVLAGGRKFELDLLALSKVLAHEGMIVACDCKMSAIKKVNSDGSPGFILEDIRRMENSEVEFYGELPPFYKGNGGLPEVKTPFKNSLVSRGQEKTTEGCFIDIKFEIPSGHAGAYLEYTKDVRNAANDLVRRGTRKCFDELFRREGGMRMLNTYGGKSRSNLMLSVAANAMGDVMTQHGIEVVPIATSHLQYWVGKPISMGLRESIQDALERRFSSEVAGDPTFVMSYLRPGFRMLDARGMKIADVRASFILESLGMGNWPVELLDRADFLVNFLEHVDPLIKKEIYDSLARHENGGRPVRMSDLRMMDLVAEICQHRRTIRDAADLISTLRQDGELPPQISDKRGEIEKWYFDFAWERFDKIFALLTKKIDEIMRNGYRK